MESTVTGVSEENTSNTTVTSTTDNELKETSKRRIRLNEIPVDDLTITLRNNGRNTVHCHEPPVVRRPLEILEDNGEVLVVDKPSSMPVHPCGRFHHNTVIFILGKNRAYVAFILCTGWIASRLGCCSSPALWKCPKNVLVWRRSTSVEWRGFPEGEIICEEPILVFSFKCAASLSRPHSPDPRPPPGYPILNDPIYGSSAWGPDRAKGGLVGMSDHDLLKAILEEHHLKANLNLLDIPDEGIGQVSNARSDVNGKDAQTPQPELLPQVCNSVSRDCKLNDVEQSANQVHSSPATPGALPRPSEENGDQTKSTESSHSASTNTRDPLCSECKIVRPDPIEKELIMYSEGKKYFIPC
ncbi:hypothetical protein J4Q44_G00247050 [Coregonus suidteri]|uniref:Pseudouridine synthase RsuA/RluA-like domain-containing protein n=1 Tax=Coregonus suidteri TaxID=861788 RepID=A0AAN8KZE6_9TELE